MYTPKYLIIIFSLFSLLIITSNNVFAENKGRIVVHFDKPFYIAGEYIWYKIYLPSSYKEQDINLSVNLFDSTKSVHQQFFLETNGQNSAYGYIKIPFDWNSQSYNLTFSERDHALKKDIIIAWVNIPIFNENEEGFTRAFSINQHTSTSNLDNKHILNIQLRDTIFHVLDKIQANLQVKDKNGIPIKASFSVSIRDWNLTNVSSSLKQTIFPFPFFNNQLVDRTDNQLHLKFKVREFKNQSGEPTTLYAYIPSDNQFFHSAVDMNGYFDLVVPKFFGKKSVHFFTTNDTNIEVELLIPDTNLNTNRPFKVSSSQITTYLENSRLRKKIYTLYAKVETPLNFVFTSNTDTSTLKPDRSIRINDYKFFPTLPLFLKEVPTTLKYRKTKGKQYTFKMFNPGFRRREFYTGNPLFIVDGQIIKDQQFIATLDMREIEKLDLFFNEGSLQQYFGEIGKSGVVFISSHSGRIKLPENNTINISGLSYPPTYPIAIESPKSEVPIFRPLLYWHPQLQTNSLGECDFAFIQSHDKGKFMIEVVAQTADGEILRSHKFYEVK